MKWAVRLGIAGIIWAILTYVLLGPHTCSQYNDLCGMPLVLVNPPLLFVMFILGMFGISDIALPSFLTNAFTSVLLIDGLFGFLVGMIVDAIFRTLTRDKK